MEPEPPQPMDLERADLLTALERRLQVQHARDLAQLRREHARVVKQVEAQAAAAKEAALEATAAVEQRLTDDLQRARAEAENARSDVTSARAEAQSARSDATVARAEAADATARAEAAEGTAATAARRLADVYASHTWRWGRRIVAGPGALKRLGRRRRE